MFCLLVAVIVSMVSSQVGFYHWTFSNNFPHTCERNLATSVEYYPLAGCYQGTLQWLKTGDDLEEWTSATERCENVVAGSTFTVDCTATEQYEFLTAIPDFSAVYSAYGRSVLVEIEYETNKCNTAVVYAKMTFDDCDPQLDYICQAEGSSEWKTSLCLGAQYSSFWQAQVDAVDLSDDNALIEDATTIYSTVIVFLGVVVISVCTIILIVLLCTVICKKKA